MFYSIVSHGVKCLTGILMCPVLLAFTFLDLDCNKQLNSYNQII